MKYLGVVSNWTPITKEELTPSLPSPRERRGLLGDQIEGGGTFWMEASAAQGDDAVARGLDGVPVPVPVPERRWCLFVCCFESQRYICEMQLTLSNRFMRVN
jgi:hypothetical protein